MAKEIKSVTAVQMIVAAERIAQGESKKVLGWTVASPYYSATAQLTTALEGLRNTKGTELIQAKAHEVYGDISLKAEIQDPKAVAAEHYTAAIDLLGRVPNFSVTLDAILRITNKMVDAEIKLDLPESD